MFNSISADMKSLQCLWIFLLSSWMKICLWYILYVFISCWLISTASFTENKSINFKAVIMFKYKKLISFLLFIIVHNFCFTRCVITHKTLFLKRFNWKNSYILCTVSFLKMLIFADFFFVFSVMLFFFENSYALWKLCKLFLFAVFTEVLFFLMLQQFFVKWSILLQLKHLMNWFLSFWKIFFSDLISNLLLVFWNDSDFFQ